MSENNALDLYLPEGIRAWLEETYYKPINQRATLEYLSAHRRWFPVGSTGVIRGASRNAHVVADQQIDVLMIPKEVYLRYWYWPYTFQEVRELLEPEHVRTA